MKIGFTLPASGTVATAENLALVATRAETLGFDTLWVADHVVLPFQPNSPYPYNSTGRFPSPSDQPYYEPLVTMAYLAGVTRQIRFGTSVLIAPYRNPVVTAKQIATMDALSGGRITVGVGVGWMAEEFEAVQAPPFEHRGTVTDECIQLFKILWTEENPSFEGKFYRIRDVGFHPKPVQRPRPPIIVGGDQPAALRRVARHGDGWQPYGYSLDELRQQLDLLRRICADEGRRYEDLIISARYGVRVAAGPQDGRRPNEEPRQVFVGTIAEIVELGKRLADMGVHEIGFHYRSDPSLEGQLSTMEQLAAEVMPKLT